MNNLTSLTIKGVAWTLWCAGGQVIFRFLSLVVLARLLMPEDFGLFATSIIVVSLFSLLAQAGVKQALVNETTLTKLQIRSAYTLVTFLGVLFTFFLIIVSEYLAIFFWGLGYLKLLLQILAITILIQSFGVVSEVCLLRESKFRELALIDLFSYVIGFVLVGILLAYFGAGAWSLIWGFLLQTIIKASMQFKMRPHSLVPLFDVSKFKNILSYGGGITLAQVSNYVALQSDNLIVGKLLGMEALGFYSRAYQLMSMPAVLFGGALDKVLFPILSKVKSEPERMKVAYSKSMLVSGLLLLPASVLLSLISCEIVLVILGEKWSDVTPLLGVFFLGLFFRSAYKLGSTVANASGIVYKNAFMQFIYALLVIIGAIVGHYWGIIGVAYGVFCAVLVNYTLIMMLSCNVVCISFISFLKLHIPCLLLTLCSGSGGWMLLEFLRNMFVSPLVVIIVMVVFYIAVFSVLIILPNRILSSELIWFKSITSKFLLRSYK